MAALNLLINIKLLMVMNLLLENNCFNLTTLNKKEEI